MAILRGRSIKSVVLGYRTLYSFVLGDEVEFRKRLTLISLTPERCHSVR